MPCGLKLFKLTSKWLGAVQVEKPTTHKSTAFDDCLQCRERPTGPC